LNFAGPFDAKLTHDSPVSLGGERFAFDSKPGFTQHHASDSHVVVPDAHLLFSGEYTRIGSDLIISGDGQKFVVGNYFKGESRPALVSQDGATLSGSIVDALTGHVHYAQATGAPAAGEVIGHVLKLSGSASVIRNGVSVELHIGDAVQKGDVVQTGSDSTVGLTFVDGSAFGMNSNARMVLNEMIYDPNGSSNSSLISLVQGTITFVAGQTAKNGNMRVETPVATMGIRGTAVLVEIGANDGPTKFSVLVEPDGHTGSYNLYDKTTGQLIGTVSQAGQVTFVSVNGIGQPPTAIEQLKTLADQQAEKALIQQVFQLFFPNYNPDNANPKSQKTGFGSPGDNINPFLFNNPTPDNQPIKIIVIPGVGNDPVTGQPNPPRIFYNTKAQFSADTVTAEQSVTSSITTFKISDVVHIDDPDIGNAPFYDTPTPFVAGSAVIKSAVSTNPNLDANFLKQFLHIDQQTGEVTFDRLGFNFLGQGETATFMLQVLSQSGPDSALVIIPIVISGDNDVPNDNGVPNGAPTIVLPLSDIVGGVQEDTPVGASSLAKDGTITFRDVDLSDTHTVSQVFTSSSSGSTLNPASNPSLPGFGQGAHLGTFTLGPIVEDATDTINTGTLAWHFSLPDNDPTLQSLAQGQTITQVYTITITDVHGAFVTQDVTITITGTNDAPVLSADASIHHAVEVPDTTGAPNSVVDTATGTLAFADLDLSDTHTATAALHPGATSVVWSGGNYNDIPQATRDALNSATTVAVTENNTDANNQGSVGWEFKLPDNLFDFLADGETLTLIYDLTVTDNNGVSSTQQITVQIGAANDQPVISVIDNGAAVKEDVDPVSGVLKDTGSVTFTDTDLTDTHTAHVVYNNDATASAGVSPALAAALITALSVPTTALVAGDHDFNWDFALNTSLVQYLAEGETITASYTITVDDNTGETNGISAGQVVTVTITGTNDAPTITSGSAAAGATVAELPDTTGSAAADHAGGTITFGDVDLTDTHQVTQSNAAFAWSGGMLTQPQIDDLNNASVRTLVSHDSTGTGSGSIDWTYNITDGALDFLALGQTLTVSYDITVADYHNGVPTGTSTVQTVTVTYTGANDAPIVSGTVSDALAVEDGPVSILNALANASDVDNGAMLSVVNIPGTLPAGVSYDPGTHTFTLDPGNAAYQHLADGATTTVTVNYGVSDGIVTTPTPASVSWTITGTNDAPTVSSALTNIVSEGDTAFTTDLLLNASDVDDGDTLSIVNVTYKVDAGTASGAAPAGVSLSGSTLSVDPTDPSFDHLAVGQNTTIVVSYDIKDALGLTVHQTETITINGTNDAPTVAAALTLDTQEGNAPVVGDLLAGAADVDTGDTLSVTNISYTIDGQPSPGTPAGVTVFEDAGTTKINVDAAGLTHLPAGVTETIVVNYDVTDQHGATVAQTETITIMGVNDRPDLVAGLNLTTITEDQTTNSGQLVSSFATGITDPDDGAVKGIAITGSSSQNGHWEYSINNGTSWTAFGLYSTSSGLLLALDDKVRFVPDGDHGGSDTLTYVAWDQTTTATHGQTVPITGGLHSDPFSFGPGQTATLTVTEVNDAPALSSDSLLATELGDGGVTHPDGTTQVSGVLLSDPDETGNLTFSAVADHGTVTKADGTTALDASGGVSESLASINGILSSGFIYTPDNQVPTDHVLLTVTDSHGVSDTLNLVFNQSGTSGATLIGTEGKDIFFATGSPDTFVFAPNSNHDVIMGGFAEGIDKIDLQALTSFDTAALTALLNTADHTGGDTLLHLNGTTDTLLLKGVATLNASDFILHA